MRLWRISNYADLKGIGGLVAPARWHNKGIPVVYLSESPALAMLEVLVHFQLDTEGLPEHYQLLEVGVDERNVSIARLADDALHEGWRQDLAVSRAIGDDWLTSLNSALLRVPSSVVPNSYNFLMNPRHKDAHGIDILSARRYPFDQRLG